MSTSPYDFHLDKTPANYQPLTPTVFLERAAMVYPDHTAIIHGSLAIPYGEFYTRARRLASALVQAGIGPGDTVSVMLSNTPSMLEAHYAVPMIGAVLHCINTRLDPPIIAFQLDHAETKLLITDTEFTPAMKEALAQASVHPKLIAYADTEMGIEGERLGDLDYEDFVQSGDPEFAWQMPTDEWNAISLNYTSGTTGNPKGVVYTHRGAALMCYANTIATGMQTHPVYLWTLPMFHCNGWCFPWALSLVSGTHVCLRQVRAKPMYDAIAEHKVTNLSGAPIVMSVLLQAGEDEKRDFDHKVAFNHAAAPPPAAVLAAMDDAGFHLTHLYGLTETYGPATLNEWKDVWDDLEHPERMALRIRQGVRYHALEGLTVKDPETMETVPADGETLGEVMFRGNIVMKGYLKNRHATEEAFAGGWFHSGDIGVLHPDGYIQLKDRSKDVIISGGENISSIEVEDVLYKHPAITAAAVVAKQDEKWGETPCAFVEVAPGTEISQDEIIAYCRDRLAHFKCPRFVVFTELPRTSTGKIQKFKLREMTEEV
ncbi:acyl-CoA synthetase [Methyloligella sp. 2.7D]|uniref:acyl-CoA synthetase n=1 Tax=unclassified Methyloligella TaxID=2625955 RepID=UPI00157C3B04|nr:acyl-CoA synthetase [Methyloligella sp. GL2]QKP76809.1 acyl-CoA synthetase [Methyloligella sp. GL2]